MYIFIDNYEVTTGNTNMGDIELILKSRIFLGAILI